MNTSVVSATISNYTSNSVRLRFELFPDLWRYKLLYTISTQEMFNKEAPVKTVTWNQQAEQLFVEVDRLNPFTVYTVDVNVKDEGYLGKSVSMSQPLIFRIKGTVEIKVFTKEENDFLLN